MRYASLHRAAEKGLDADETWAELAQVCVELGLHDEAVRSYEKIKTPAERVRIHNLLVRQRLIEKQETQLHEVGEEYTRGRLVDDVQEAVHFLAQDHMPMTVTVATAMFPLVIGIGGYMTSGSSFFLLPLIAMLPAVLVLMAVGALARRVLMDSAIGIEDAPVLPEPHQLRREATRAGAEALGISGALFGPAVLLGVLGAPARLVVATLAIAAVLFPMALMLRIVREDWQALAPRVLFPALVRGGVHYLQRVLAVVAMFLPAIGCWYASGNAVVYLQLALVGPLLVAPLLISARLLGRFLHTHRSVFHSLMDIPEPGRAKAQGIVKVADAVAAAQVAAAPPLQSAPRPQKTRPAAAPRQKPAPQPKQPAARTKQVARPAAAAPRRAPSAPRPAPAQQQPTTPRENATPPSPQRPAPARPKPARPVRAKPTGQPGPVPVPKQRAAPAQRKPAPKPSKRPQNVRLPEPPARSTTVTASQLAPLLATKGQNRAPTVLSSPLATLQVLGEPLPDLLNMPGVSIVTGPDRVRAGAASNKP